MVHKKEWCWDLCKRLCNKWNRVYIAEHWTLSQKIKLILKIVGNEIVVFLKYKC